MNRLWVHLTMAFALVTVIAILIVAVLANWQTSNQFRRYFALNQIYTSDLPRQLAVYYTEYGSWQGVEAIFQSTHIPGQGPGQGQGQGRGRGLAVGQGNTGMFLLDSNGQIVYAGGPGGNGGHLPPPSRASAIPIQVQDQVVGYLAVHMSAQNDLPPPAQSLLNQINHVLIQAGLIAASLAILVGLVITWRITIPLDRLSTAARRFAQGDLEQRVPVVGTQEVANLARAFNDMADHLQQAERIRRNLVADIAHELRTPLSVIQGNLQAILDDVYPLEKAEIATIYDETIMLHRLVHDLRDLSQAEAGQLSLAVQPTEIEPIVSRIVVLFGELAAQKQIRLTVTPTSHIPCVQADPDRLAQIVYNLLANALRHTPEGGQVALRIKPETQPPGVEPEGYVCFEVVDTGSGIPAQDLPFVFDRFWRADKSRSRSQGGSGLGLAIARQLVESQGGRIGVSSNPGQGSCFWFTLPCVREGG